MTWRAMSSWRCLARVQSEPREARHAVYCHEARPGTGDGGRIGARLHERAVRHRLPRRHQHLGGHRARRPVHPRRLPRLPRRCRRRLHR